MFGIRSETEAALRDLGRLERHARYAHAVALTRIAQIAQGELRAEAARRFQSATPYTLNSTYVRPATPGRLVAEVGFKGATANRPHYLAAEVTGGSRTVKRFEALLRQYGVLGVNEYVVPARGFPLDPFGNIPRGVYTAVLSDVQAHPDQYARSTGESRARRGRFMSLGRSPLPGMKNRTRAGIYFATRPGDKLPLGIYQRVKTSFGTVIRGVFMFVSEPKYRVRLPLLEIVTRVYDRHIADEINKQLNNAFATAR